MDTLGQVCRELRISRKTLKKWLDRLNIEPTKHPRDWRFYVLTIEQVEAIRVARSEMPTAHYGGGQVVVRPPARVVTPAPSDLALERVQGHIGQTALPRARSRAKTQRLRDELEPPLGWVAETSFCRDHHGIPLRTVEEAEKDGRLSVTHQQRYRLSPRVFATNWLTVEQQAEFHRAFRSRLGDPCRVCGASSASDATDGDTAASAGAVC